MQIFQNTNPVWKPHNNQLLNLNKFATTNENKGNQLLHASAAKHYECYNCTACVAKIKNWDQFILIY